MDIGPRLAAARQRRTTHAIVVEEIRRQILDGVLEPGDRLLLDDLARDLGVSATPVREALYQLVVEGTVTIDPYRGFSVSELTVAEAQDLFETRALLASEAARLATLSLTDEALARLRQIVDQMETAQQANEPRIYLHWDRDFHATLYAQCGRSVLLRHLTSLSNSSVRYQRYQQARLTIAGVMEASLDEHGQMVQALERRDAKDMKHLVRQHVMASAQWVAHFLSVEREGGEPGGTAPAEAAGQ